MKINVQDLTTSFNKLSWDILELIQKEPVNYKKLREETGTSQDKMYREIARLEGAMLIVSEKDAVDQRVTNYSLSEYGKYVLENR